MPTQKGSCREVPTAKVRPEVERRALRPWRVTTVAVLAAVAPSEDWTTPRTSKLPRTRLPIHWRASCSRIICCSRDLAAAKAPWVPLALEARSASVVIRVRSLKARARISGSEPEAERWVGSLKSSRRDPTPVGGWVGAMNWLLRPASLPRFWAMRLGMVCSGL